MILLGDHSSCTSRRCEVCPARDNSENPSKNSDPVAEDFSFENENRELTKQEVKKEPSEENSEKAHSEQDSENSDVSDDDNENSSEDDEDDDDPSASRDKAEFIRMIMTSIGELESQNREKFEQYRLQPTLLDEMDFCQVRTLAYEINVKHQLQIAEHQGRLVELEVRTKLQAMIEKVRSKIDELKPGERNEFNDYMKNNTKEILKIGLDNLDMNALEVVDFKVDEILQKRRVIEEKKKRIGKLKNQIDKLSDDSKSSIFYYIKLESLEKLPDDHLKRLEAEVSNGNRGLILTVIIFITKLHVGDRDAYNEFVEYARRIVTEPFELDAYDKNALRSNLIKLDARTLKLLISKAQRLLTRLDKRRRKSSHEEESRPKKKSRNEL